MSESCVCMGVYNVYNFFRTCENKVVNEFQLAELEFILKVHSAF